MLIPDFNCSKKQSALFSSHFVILVGIVLRNDGMVSSTEPNAILNTNIVDGFNGIQNTPLIQQLSLTEVRD
jgi:hypothetical protein